MKLIREEREIFYQRIEKLMGKGDRKPKIARSCGELEASWSEIDNAIKNGAEFKVGDYKSDRTLNGRNFTMVVTDVTEEYVRFKSRDCFWDGVAWDKNGGTKGGYPASDVHNYLNTELWGILPEDLKNVISPCERKTLVGGEIVVFTANIFLPAASEVFADDDCWGDNGIYKQLEYYKDRKHRVRWAMGVNGSVGYWLGSVRADSTAACAVTVSGSATSYSMESKTTNFPICFVIKKS